MKQTPTCSLRADWSVGGGLSGDVAVGRRCLAGGTRVADGTEVTGGGNSA